MKRKLLVVILLLSVSYPSLTFAWGRRGHTLVAQIAVSFLDSPEQKRLQKYLGDMTMEQAGNWMDEIKSEHRYDFMKPWHYVNVEQGKTYEATKEENVINQLSRVINELEHKENMKNDDIRKDLLIAFHLTGDLHQPLHVGYGTDKGGNDLHVKYKNNSTNLHHVWDSDIIDGEHITLSDCINRLKTYDKEQIAMLSVINVETWMRQPRSQLTSVYNFKDDNIDDAYIQKNKKVIEDDLLTAGIRLSALLKIVLKA